jgi:hypothetical protein
MMMDRSIAGAVAIIVIALCLSGCVCGNVTPGETSTALDTSIDVGVRVLDLVNNTPVIGAPVYFLACSPNGTGARVIHLNDTTGDDGWAYFQVNYTLYKDETVFLGASGAKPLLEADFTGRAFNGSGYLGEWKSVNYSFLYNPGSNETAFVGYAITVDRDTGRMI